MVIVFLRTNNSLFPCNQIPIHRSCHGRAALQSPNAQHQLFHEGIAAFEPLSCISPAPTLVHTRRVQRTQGRQTSSNIAVHLMYLSPRLQRGDSTRELLCDFFYLPAFKISFQNRCNLVFCPEASPAPSHATHPLHVPSCLFSYFPFPCLAILCAA